MCAQQLADARSRSVEDVFGGQFPNEPVERFADDQFHGVVIGVATFAEVVDGNNVGVMQPTRGGGLTTKAGDRIGTRRAQNGRQHLQRHLPIQP